MHTSFDSVTATGIHRSAHVVTTNSGVSLTDIGGESYVKTSFGSVKAANIAGPLTVEATNTSVKAQSIHGAAMVRTSFGSVKLDDVFGGVDVDNQNGAVEVSVLPAKNPSGGCNAVNLRTSFSPLRIYLDESAKYDVTAHVTFGKVSSELPVTATGISDGESLNGKINGGGCQLQLANNNGGIQILKGGSQKR